MFSYYGSKSKIVDYYPQPKYKTIIEPFAGSARYSLKYFENEIILIEKFDKVFRLWKYLQQASEKDILSLPDMNNPGDDVRLIQGLCDEERWLIGFHLRRGGARPSCTRGERCSWEKDKVRIANDLYKIKHWQILFDDYKNMPIIDDATYFLDPPYSVQKHKYNHHKIDYVDLKDRIESLNGQVIVCGNSDDSWLDFKPLIKMQGINKSHIECIYTKNC